MGAAEIARIVQSDMSVSDKIRALAAGGCARADIARALGKRYQHVRNVLEADRANAARQGLAETSPPFSRDPPDIEARGNGVYRLTVRTDGSVVLPPEVRAAFGVSGVGIVMARLEGDEFKLISTATAWRRAQALVAAHVDPSRSLADEVIAYRREEVALEEAKYQRWLAETERDDDR